MTNNAKEECVRRVGLPVAAQTTQDHSTAQQQPAGQATEVAATAPADTPVPENEPGDILCTMLSANAAQQGWASVGSTASVTVDGHVYSRTVTKVQYSVNSDITSGSLGSLVDRGANGGVLGEDMLILSIIKLSKVDISGVLDTTVLDLTLCQGASVLTTESGRKIVGIFHQYANLGKGRSIHSMAQLENFGMKIDGRSKYLGGTQQRVTPEGHVIPFSVRDGLTKMDMRPPLKVRCRL
jgi:hypothetical protein